MASSGFVFPTWKRSYFMKIDPESLRSLRKKKKLSRSRLAERSGIAVRTIQRLENEPQRCQKSREDTVNRLADALDVEPDVLSGISPLPKPDKKATSDPRGVQIGAQVAPRARLFYDLVRRRYGVSATEIITMAPLFFTLLAEGSLAWRREKLKQAREALDLMVEADLNFVEANETLTMKMNRSNADIFRRHRLSARLDPWYSPRDNPFASYLRKLAKDIDQPGVVDVDSEDWEKFPDYGICSHELRDIVNKSPDAWACLVNGYARISDIPEELMADDSGEKRAKWLEDRLPSGSNLRPFGVGIGESLEWIDEGGDDH